MTSLKRRLAMFSVVLAAFALAGTTGLCAEDDASIDNRKTAAGGGAPWLQFRVTEKDLDKIAVSRSAFVFPKDVVVKDTRCFAMKDGYLFVAKEALYITDRAGKLVVEHKRPHPRGGVAWGDDWFAYGSGFFHADGKQFGQVTVSLPYPCTAVISRDGSRIFFLRTRDPDLIRLQGPIVADVRTGKVLKEHQFEFGGAMAEGYYEATKDGFIGNLRSQGGLICFDSSGEIAWRSALQYAPAAPFRSPYLEGHTRSHPEHGS